MASTEFVDPYLDPETGLLRNKVGAQTQVALDEAEGDLSFARLVQLMDHPVKPTGGLDELRAIHRYLFQDVYDWAGELRTVDIRKNVEGAQFFLPVSMIGRAASYVEGELRADHELRGMSREQFIDRLAYHYDQLNYVHPFREGNGRTQRVFWNRVARDAGWQLDWREVHGATNDQASRAASEQRDFGPLREMFDQIVSKATPQGERDAPWHAAERARLSFPTKRHRGRAPAPEWPAWRATGTHHHAHARAEPPRAWQRRTRSESMTRIGYARVSTREQNSGAQEAELRAAGAVRVFVDRGESSRVRDRPQWIACLDYLRPGDTLLVRRLDRIASSEKMAIETINDLAERGVNIRSLTEPAIDTTTPMGRALFGIVAVFAQLRVDTIRENTLRGLAHARAQGRVGGRPTVMTPERVRAAAQMRREGKTFAHIAAVLGVGKSTVARALARLSETP